MKKELDRRKSVCAKPSDMSAKYSGMEEKLATSENKNLDLQRTIEKLEADLDTQASPAMSLLTTQALTHAAELADRDDEMEARVPRLSLEDFKERLDRNQLVSGRTGWG